MAYSPDGLTPAITELYTVMDCYLYQPSFDHVLATLAAAVAKDIIGFDPLWLMLIAVSSSGKNEAADLVDGVVDHKMSDITKAGLLTAQGEGGLLTKMQGRNALVRIADFSTVLGDPRMSGGDHLDVFNALRDIYDGEYSRDLATGSLHWKGRLSFIASCTPAIDRFATHGDALGTRWLYYRMIEKTIEQRKAQLETVKRRKKLAATQGSLKALRVEAKNLATKIISDARHAVHTSVLSDEVEDAIQDTAILVSYGRASVPRDYRQQISDLPTTEEPGRLASQLQSFALGLMALGLTEEVVLRIVRHAALSSMPQARVKVLQVVADEGDLTTYAISKRSDMAQQVAQRALEDWDAVGVMSDGKMSEEQITHKWNLTAAYRPYVNSALWLKQPGCVLTGIEKKAKEEEQGNSEDSMSVSNPGLTPELTSEAPAPSTVAEIAEEFFGTPLQTVEA